MFAQTTVQSCIIHLIRNSLAFVSWKDRKIIMPDLKAIYRAETAAAALAQLDAFEAKWGKRYPAIGQAWRRAWEHVVPLFAFPPAIRKMIYTTDEIDKHFSARLPAGFGIGGALGRAMQPFLSVEGTVAKRAARMRLCQRRQPPKAVAAGQRLQSRILAATIARGARGAALFKGKVARSRTACSGRNLVRVVSSVCTGDRVAKSKAGG